MCLAELIRISNKLRWQIFKKEELALLKKEAIQ